MPRPLRPLSDVVLPLIVGALAATASAEVLPVPNPGLAPDGAATSLAESVPKGWSRQGKASDVRAFAREEGDWAVALAGGARIATDVALPGLGEGQDPAAFQVLVSVDVLGTAEEGKRGTWELELLAGRRVLAVVRGAVDEVAATSADPGPVRGWVRVAGSTLAGLDGPLTIRVAGRAGVVVDEVRAYRLPVLPTGAMLAKPNGVDGPDAVDSGALGFSGFTVHDHAPLPVMAVRDGSPAAAAGLRAGDVIVGVGGAPIPISSCQPGWRWFEDGHEAVLGRAVQSARRTGSRGTPPRVALTVLRDDGRGRGNADAHDLEVALDPAPALGDGFPFQDARTDSLHADLIDYVLRTQRPEGRWANDGNDAIQTCFAALALLGTRDPAHGERVRRAVDWTMRRFAHPEDFGNLGYWMAGYAGILVCEYHLATGDARVLPWIEQTLQWAVDYPHTSRWRVPALGHGPDGLPYDQKSLVAPSVHLLVFEALAVRCGARSRVWELLLPFMELAWSDPSRTYGKNQGHGALGYNASYRDLGEFWSRSGLFALAAHLRGERPDMAAAMAKVMVERHPWMRNSHAYGAPGDVWGLIGLSQVDPQGFRAVMAAWAPLLEGAWEPGFGLRYSTPHMGSPYMGAEGLINPAFAALLTVRRAGLHITGATDRGWLRLDEAVAGPPALTIARDGDGRVSIDPGGPDVEVRFTLDGAVPMRDSPRYLGPFPLRGVGLVSARARVGDRWGPLVRRAFAPSKATWTIVDASGDEDPARAIERARHLIDEDPRLPWIPDRGLDAAGYPHRVVIDLGETMTVAGVQLANGGGKEGAASARITLGASAANLTPDAAGPDSGAGGGPPTRVEATLETGGVREVRFAQPASGRFLRLDLLEGHGGAMALRELDVIAPSPRVDRAADGRVVLSATSGAALHYTLDGRTPSPSSPRYDSPLVLPTGGLVLARAFEEGVGSAPVAAWVPASREGWSARASTEEGDGRAAYVLDGDLGTLWHSAWRGGAASPPHELVVDTGAVRTWTALLYSPRVDGENGVIREYRVYVGSDDRRFGDAVASGTFEGPREDGAWIAPFDRPATGRYVKLVAVSEAGGRPFASAAEVGLVGTSDVD